MVYRKTRKANLALAFLLLVLTSNFLLYQSEVPDFLSLPLTSGVAIGSLIDFAIVAPFLVYLAFKISIKQTLGLMVFGLVLAKFLIPANLYAPYREILYTGLALEALLVLAEIALIFIVIRKASAIRNEMKEMNEDIIYSLLPSVEKIATKNVFIRIIMSEFLMFYYALFTWKKKAPSHEGVVTMHEKTSAVAMNIMLIHAIVIETIGIHWWLHEKSLVLSIILLVLNVYSVFFIIADIQITRLHPMEIKNGKLYITQGMASRIIVSLSNIKEVEWGAALPNKNTLQFVYKDFEKIEPQAIIRLHEPVEATMFMGIKKKATEFAIRVDEPQKLKDLLKGLSDR
ncbi:beta-carotene 15,15'-monooxygenase [Psychrobacillus vulpis]|uniref:Beta-carotene 15,15'-monooxygenase n=1 Tax=Psychrobacillus vulpis TaxID=2325572 RepID=A0A544TVT2_9BACI|nr:beta-carotene 15,15'-monooxygenase [Psychrobacillus vulpis]TQR21555.1 beta-carotene 15,15'-monooxygenase [Psychrobacillus vulpis]